MSYDNQNRKINKKRTFNSNDFADYNEFEELKQIERIDDGFKDEENVKNKRAGAPIAPLGGSEAYYFDYKDEYPDFEDVISLEFQQAGKVYWYFYPENKEKPEEEQIVPGDTIVAYSERGVELAKVLNKSHYEFKRMDKINFIKNGVIRKATRADLDTAKRLEKEALEAKKICEEENRNLGIKMKLVRVKYTLDNKKALFYFYSDGRVDFRELIKRLAYKLRKRIEMRQIGIRDTTKIMGGLGPCGQELCCKKFAHKFNPVSIKMAKDQNLALSSSKISGICGRLFCCLSFEDKVYNELKKDYPRLGTLVWDGVTERLGMIKKIDVIQKKLTIVFNNRLEEGKFYNYEEIYGEQITYPYSQFEETEDKKWKINKKEEEIDLLKNIKPVLPVEKSIFKNEKNPKKKKYNPNNRKPRNRTNQKNKDSNKEGFQSKNDKSKKSSFKPKKQGNKKRYFNNNRPPQKQNVKQQQGVKND